MNYFLILVITALSLTACISHQSVSTENIPPKIIYQSEEKYAELDNLTQTGLLHTLGEVIIKDPIIGSNIPQTIDGDILPTIAHRNELRSLDYRDYNPGVRTDIVYPAFLQLSLTEQAKLLELYTKNNPQELIIQFVSTGEIDAKAFQESFRQLPKASVIRLEFYSIPVNYYELFEVMDERLTRDSEIGIRIWLPDLPIGFSVDAFFLHVKKWINRHPNHLVIKNFWFSILNTPGMQFVLEHPASVLGDFPAKRVSADPVVIDTRGEPPGDGPKGKAVIEQFFKNSTVEEMLFDFGKKEGEKIEVYGY